MSTRKPRYEIRPLQKSDYRAWLPLWIGYQTFYKTQIADDITEETFSHFFDPELPVQAAVAVTVGELIGLVHFIEHYSTWTRGKYCYLQDIFVLEKARGTGAGRALIKYVYAQAAERQCARVYWLTHETNTQAIHLYDQLADRSGFVQYRKLLP